MSGPATPISSPPLARVPGAAADSLRQAARVLGAFLADDANARRIEEVAGVLAGCFEAGGKAMICGNGGSACDAMHFAEELTGRFRPPLPGRPDRRPLPALACTDVGHITCTANDYGFDEVFARWVRALGKPGDVLILLSTSGDSENVVRAAAAGRELGVRTVALLGRTGGRLRGACDHEWVVSLAEDPGLPADRIQEIHMLVLHTLIERVEWLLAPA